MSEAALLVAIRLGCRRSSTRRRLFQARPLSRPPPETMNGTRTGRWIAWGSSMPLPARSSRSPLQEVTADAASRARRCSQARTGIDASSWSSSPKSPPTGRPVRP
eukprot:3602699-Pyramimonas_sp.AAC.1